MSDLMIRGTRAYETIQLFYRLSDKEVEAFGLDYLEAYARIDANHFSLSNSTDYPELKSRIDDVIRVKGGDVKFPNSDYFKVTSGDFIIGLSVTRVRRWLRVYHPDRITDVGVWGAEGTPLEARALELGLDVEEITGERPGALYILVHKATGHKVSVGGPYANLSSARWNMRNRIPWAVAGDYTVIEDLPC
jgi:hypothetical protein